MAQNTNIKKKIYGLLNEDELQLLNNLISGWTKEQILWVSGYLAGKAEPKQAVVAQDVAEIQVLFGTHSGNSEILTDKLVDKGSRAGLSISGSIMEKFDVARLSSVKNLLVIVSTHGEGEAPANALGFLNYLRKEKGNLGHLNFAVLGLGDSTFENFCQAGIDFHRALKQSGAKPLFPLEKSDVEFMPVANAWIEKVINHFTPDKKDDKKAVQTSALNLGGLNLSQGQQTSLNLGYKRVFDRSNPFYATILKKQLLSKTGSKKEVCHFELSIKGSGFSYEPGDTLSVVGDNPPSLVEDILNEMDWDKNSEVVFDKHVINLGVALRNNLEITRLKSSVLEKYHKVAQSQELFLLISDQQKLQAYLYGNDLLDLLKDFPCSITPQELVSILLPLPARKYSISSCLDKHPGEAHITVAAVRYENNKRLHQGAVSTFVTDRVNEGDKIPVFVLKNKKFNLPENKEAPLIMIGPGTGIAPFRSFIEYYEANKLQSDKWLFFGDQHENFDFLYENELKSWNENGVLNELSTAFSRDQQDKMYVQHRLLEQKQKVWEWLKNGAYIYVCGDKKHMATDVHLALLDIVKEEGKMDINAAKQFLNNLVTAKRYQKDVY